MAERIAFVVYLQAKAGMGDLLMRHLMPVLEAMSKEDDFVSTYLHHLAGDEDMIVLYEIWDCSQADFVNIHLRRPYRSSYEAALPGLLATERKIDFLVPLKEWPQA